MVVTFNKDFIENTVNNLNPRDKCDLINLQHLRRAISSRVSFEFLKKYNSNPKKTINELEVKELWYGLNLNLETIAKEIYIPSRFLKDKKTSKWAFTIFDRDDYNMLAFQTNFTPTERDYIQSTIYKNNNKKITILELLEDKDWRNKASQYALLMQKVIYTRNFKKQMTEQNFKAIYALSKQYFSEMK